MLAGCQQANLYQKGIPADYKISCVSIQISCILFHMKNAGDRVRERRQALKLSQPQLAKKAGITYQAIQQLEAGGGSKQIGRAHV